MAMFNFVTVFLVLATGTSSTSRHINILYDAKLNTTWVDMTLTFIQSTLANTAPDDDNVYISKKGFVAINTFEIQKERQRSDTSGILLIYCTSCHVINSWFRTSPDMILLCVDMRREDFLNTCRTWTLETDLWSTLIRQLSMNEAVLFYDQSTANSLSSIIDALPSTYSTYWNDDASDVTIATIKKHNQKIQPSTLINTDHHNFIITTSTEHATEIISMSQNIKLLGPDFNWLVDMRHDSNVDNMRALSSLMQDGDNTAIVSRSTDFAKYQREDLEKTITRLRDEHYQINSDENVVPALVVQKCVVSCDGERVLTRVATMYSDGNTTSQGTIFPGQFEGFHGRVFNIVVKTYEPFINRKRDSEGHFVYSGMCIELLDALADVLNFRYNLFEVPDGKFGVKNESGQWNGLIGTVMRKEADMAVAGLTISATRDEVVDFTFPYWEEPSTVLLRKPNDESKMRSLFRPFKLSTWYSVVSSVIVSSVIIYGMCLISRRVVGTPELLTSYPECLWYSYGALLGQGVDKQPVSIASRIVASCWWLIVIVIYAVYTGNLIAFLTVTIPVMPFDTLLEMTQQTEYYYGLEDGIVHMMLFQEANDGVYRDIWRGIQSNFNRSVVRTTAIGLDKVAKEKYAFIGEKTFLQMQSANDCKLVMIGEEFFKSGFGFAVQEGWPFTKYLDQVIMSMVESGFINHWKRKHWVASKCDDHKTVVQLQPTDLDGISGEFLIFLVGGGLASIALLIEVLYARGRHKKPNRKHTTAPPPSSLCRCQFACCKSHRQHNIANTNTSNGNGELFPGSNNSNSNNSCETPPKLTVRAVVEEIPMTVITNLEENAVANIAKRDSFTLSIKNLHHKHRESPIGSNKVIPDDPNIYCRKVKNTDNTIPS